MRKEKRDPVGDKKPFDKKAFRLKKYSHKYRVEKWEAGRKKRVLKSYYENLKNDPDRGKYKPFDFDDRPNEHSDGESDSPIERQINYVVHPSILENLQKKSEAGNAVSSSEEMKPFRKALQEMRRIKEEKLKKKQEHLESKKRKAEALEMYKKNKAEKFKKLSKKNARGQPAMKGRMNMLLEKIQKTVRN